MSCAQAQREDFFRLACDMRRAVEALEDAFCGLALEDAFCGLAGCPKAIGEAMPRLSAAASIVTDHAQVWAILGNQARRGEG